MTAGEQPLLSVAGLEVRFGDDAPAVSNVELTVRSGQTVAVVGESGSGKSTTAAGPKTIWQAWIGRKRAPSPSA